MAGHLSQIRLDSYKPLRELVCEHIREAIINGVFAPGERLMEIQMADEMGVSRTPVREAIRKLEMEGFVVMIPRRGTYVSNMSIKDINDVYEIRTSLDILAAGLAAERINDDELEELQRQLVELALAEDLHAFAAVRALEVTVVLHKAVDRDVHHPRHVDGLGDDHGHETLRARDDHDTVDRQRLEHRQHHVACSGRQVDEHIVHLAPAHIGPELLDRAADDRAAPDDGVRLIGQQQVDGHDLDALRRDGREHPVVAADDLLVQAEGLRNGRAGDVGVENGGLVAKLVHGHGQHGGHGRFADAALAGDDGDDLFHLRVFVGFGKQALLLAVRTAFAAARTVAAASAHNQNTPFVSFFTSFYHRGTESQRCA